MQPRDLIRKQKLPRMRLEMQPLTVLPADNGLIALHHLSTMPARRHQQIPDDIALPHRGHGPGHPQSPLGIDLHLHQVERQHRCDLFLVFDGQVGVEEVLAGQEGGFDLVLLQDYCGCFGGELGGQEGQQRGYVRF